VIKILLKGQRMSKAIEVENLVFRYHLKEALHKISFCIESGEWLACLVERCGKAPP
jgi:ABC-type multidrug transport system fused ATPase/permease subunit